MSARAALLAAVLVGAASGAARAERLVLSLSTSRVAISSSYDGARLVLFGVIERDGQTGTRQGGYEAVVTVSGPREALTIRRKEPLGPIWLNRGQQKFISVPSVLGVYSSRPLGEIASRPVRQRLRLGLEAVVNAPEFTIDRGEEDDPYRGALVRLKTRDRLYGEDPHGVRFVTDGVIRAPLLLPAVAPLGSYDVEAAILSDGVVIARQKASFEVVKAGFEQHVTDFARDRPTLYGLVTAALSVGFGWLASVIFRRD